MSMKDPISDLFTRIRNAASVGHESTVLPASKLKINILKLLKSEGYIRDFEVLSVDRVKQELKIYLKYDQSGVSVINHISRVSKCSKRIYTPKKRVPKIRDGFGTSILSTSKGVLTGRDARKNNVGGELLAVVY